MKLLAVLSILRGAACAFAAVASFLGVGSALAAWAPFPSVPVVAPKLAYFAEHSGDFDALFIGSSRVQFQVIPSLFDKVAQTHSFNLGVAGMVPPESWYFVRCVLAVRSARLKWIFVELPELDSVIDTRMADSARGAYWHDAHHSWIACRDLWLSGRDTGQKLSNLAAHGMLLAQHFANTGRGSELVAQRLDPRTRRDNGSAFAQNGGFIGNAETALSAGQLDRIHASLDELHSRNWPLIPLRTTYREGLTGLIADIRRAGIEPIFFVAPTFNWRKRLTGVPDHAPLLTFYDEARYAPLFDPQNYSDTVHLNASGSALFTTALAEQFAALPR